MANTLNWRDLSAICFGLIVTKRVDPTKYNAAIFCDPYEEGYNLFFRDRKGKTDLIAHLGSAYEEAIQAAENISEASSIDVDWHVNLTRACKLYAQGTLAARAAKRMLAGEMLDPEDALKISSGFKDIANPSATGLINARDVDVEHYDPIEPSGCLPIDLHLGGMIKAGNIQLMATTGTGKSLFSQWFWGNWLHHYKNRVLDIWSLEMGNEDYLYRGKNMYPRFWQAVQEGRVLISDKTTNIHDIGLEAAASRADAVVVDYADYLPEGAQDEAGMGIIYRTQNNISRDLKIPFMMILQPNRSAYTTGVPEPRHARYSGMAENIAAQFWVLYRPKDDSDLNGHFTYIEDSIYLIAWKQRFGWLTSKKAKELKSTWMPNHDGHGRKGPGAIVLPERENLWDDVTAGEWLVHGALPKTVKAKYKKE